MEEKQQKYSQFHLTSQVSKTYFSAVRDNNEYSLLYVQIYGDFITLRFKTGKPGGESKDLSCYLPPAKAFDLSRWLEGFMARRRDEYNRTGKYEIDKSDKLRIPLTKYVNGKDEITGYITCGQFLIDETYPKLGISYTDIKTNTTITVIFSNSVKNNLETDKKLDFDLDYSDIDAFDFVITLKELHQNPLIGMMYRIQDSAVNTIIKYFKACFNGSQGKPSTFSAPSGYKNINEIGEDTSPSWDSNDDPF